jgi:hypothetical protein
MLSEPSEGIQGQPDLRQRLRPCFLRPRPLNHAEGPLDLYQVERNLPQRLIGSGFGDAPTGAVPRRSCAQASRMAANVTVS